MQLPISMIRAEPGGEGSRFGLATPGMSDISEKIPGPTYRENPTVFNVMRESRSEFRRLAFSSHLAASFDPRGQRNLRSNSAMGRSLMLASRLRINPLSANSHCSLP